MIGIESPESVHPDESRNSPIGIEAAEFTKSKLHEGSTVYLQRDVSDADNYGRLLRYVWLEKPSSGNPSEEEIENKMLNAVILKNGYAVAYEYEPDVKYSSLFKKLADSAKESRYGMWGNQGDMNWDSGSDSYVNDSAQSSQEAPPAPEPEPEPQSYKQSASPNDPAYIYAQGRPIGNKNRGIYHNQGQDS